MASSSIDFYSLYIYTHTHTPMVEQQKKMVVIPPHPPPQLHSILSAEKYNFHGLTLAFAYLVQRRFNVFHYIELSFLPILISCFTGHIEPETSNFRILLPTSGLPPSGFQSDNKSLPKL